MSTPHARRLLLIAIPILVIAAVGPSLMRMRRLQGEIARLDQEVHTGHLMADDLDEAPGDLLTEGEVFGALIDRLAGDRAGRFGDLTFGEPQSFEEETRVPFAVSGAASFKEVGVALDGLRQLWPVVRVDGFVITKSESGPLLGVTIEGHVRFPDDPHALRRHPSAGPFLADLVRDPFRHGTTEVARSSSVTNTRTARGVGSATPPFQGTVVIAGEEFAFFGGRAYRTGERVGDRRLNALVDGRPVLAPLGD